MTAIPAIVAPVVGGEAKPEQTPLPPPAGGSVCLYFSSSCSSAEAGDESYCGCLASLRLFGDLIWGALASCWNQIASLFKSIAACFTFRRAAPPRYVPPQPPTPAQVQQVKDFHAKWSRVNYLENMLGLDPTGKQLLFNQSPEWIKYRAEWEMELRALEPRAWREARDAFCGLQIKDRPQTDEEKLQVMIKNAAHPTILRALNQWVTRLAAPVIPPVVPAPVQAPVEAVQAAPVVASAIPPPAVALSPKAADAILIPRFRRIAQEKIIDKDGKDGSRAKAVHELKLVFRALSIGVKRGVENEMDRRYFEVVMRLAQLRLHNARLAESQLTKDQAYKDSIEDIICDSHARQACDILPRV